MALPAQQQQGAGSEAVQLRLSNTHKRYWRNTLLNNVGPRALLLLTWLSHSVPWVPLSLQKRLPADSKLLEASDLVYTVSAQEYWQQALLTEEETGCLCIFILDH